MLFTQIDFTTFFDNMFNDTEINKRNGQYYSQTIIVYETEYFQSLNIALKNDIDFTEEGLGRKVYFSGRE